MASTASLMLMWENFGRFFLASKHDDRGQGCFWSGLRCLPDAHVRELGSLENFVRFFLSSQHDNGCVAVLAGCVGLGWGATGCTWDEHKSQLEGHKAPSTGELLAGGAHSLGHWAPGASRCNFLAAPPSLPLPRDTWRLTHTCFWGYFLRTACMGMPQDANDRKQIISTLLKFLLFFNFKSSQFESAPLKVYLQTFKNTFS